MPGAEPELRGFARMVGNGVGAPKGFLAGSLGVVSLKIQLEPAPFRFAIFCPNHYSCLTGRPLLVVRMFQP